MPALPGYLPAGAGDSFKRPLRGDKFLYPFEEYRVEPLVVLGVPHPEVDLGVELALLRGKDIYAAAFCCLSAPLASSGRKTVSSVKKVVTASLSLRFSASTHCCSRSLIFCSSADTATSRNGWQDIGIIMFSSQGITGSTMHEGYFLL